MHQILSPSNALLQQWRNLTSRRKRGEERLFLAEGDHLVGEAFAAGLLRSLLVRQTDCEHFQHYILRAEADGIPVYTLSERAFSALCDTRTPQGVAGICAMPSAQQGNALLHCNRVVMLNGVQDPGNVGTILRTADAAGFDMLVADSACADPYSPKALRAAMGSAFRIPVILSPMDRALEAVSHRCDCYAGVLGGAPFYRRASATRGVCIVVGNEGNGIDPALSSLPFVNRVQLPMPGRAESLNVAVAAAVMMYDFVREDQKGR